jgi:hypothetical protein
MLTLGIRKLIVLGIVALVFVTGNALVLVHWQNEVGVIDWADWSRTEFLTGTAITIIVVLLILLVPARGISSFSFSRTCPICNARLVTGGKYCPECGGRV